MDVRDLLHLGIERPDWWMRKGFLISRKPGVVSTTDIYFWDDDESEFYNTAEHHLPLAIVYGWIYLPELEDAMFKKMNGNVIEEVGGFKVGDKVRLDDGDGRAHIIKEFIEEEGIHGPNFYRVIFEDDTASDHIFPGEPSYARTHMVKIENE